MSDLDLVEEYPKEYTTTLFEKVLMASKRAKDLHRGQTQLVPSYHRDTYVALEEIRENAIKLEYREEAPPAHLGHHEGDEEEDV